MPILLSTFVRAHISPRILGAMLLGQAVAGAANGVVFASMLAIAGRRKTFETLSLPWIAVYGAAGGVLFPFAVRAVLFSTMHLPIPPMALLLGFVTNAVLGAGLATLTLSIARRAPALRGGNDPAVPAIDAGAA